MKILKCKTNKYLFSSEKQTFVFPVSIATALQIPVISHLVVFVVTHYCFKSCQFDNQILLPIILFCNTFENLGDVFVGQLSSSKSGGYSPPPPLGFPSMVDSKVKPALRLKRKGRKISGSTQILLIEEKNL